MTNLANAALVTPEEYIQSQERISKNELDAAARKHALGAAVQIAAGSGGVTAKILVEEAATIYGWLTGGRVEGPLPTPKTKERDWTNPFKKTSKSDLPPVPGQESSEVVIAKLKDELRRAENFITRLEEINDRFVSDAAATNRESLCLTTAKGRGKMDDSAKAAEDKVKAAGPGWITPLGVQGVYGVDLDLLEAKGLKGTLEILNLYLDAKETCKKQEERIKHLQEDLDRANSHKNETWGKLERLRKEFEIFEREARLKPPEGLKGPLKRSFNSDPHQMD